MGNFETFHLWLRATVTAASWTNSRGRFKPSAFAPSVRLFSNPASLRDVNLGLIYHVLSAAACPSRTMTKTDHVFNK